MQISALSHFATWDWFCPMMSHFSKLQVLFHFSTHTDKTVLSAEIGRKLCELGRVSPHIIHNFHPILSYMECFVNLTDSGRFL